MSDASPAQAEGERARKVILVASEGTIDRLEPIVEQWIRDRIAWVAVVGFACAEIEDRIDWLLIGNDRDRSHFMVTTSHRDETLEEITEFMLSMVDDYEGDVAIVEL